MPRRLVSCILLLSVLSLATCTPHEIEARAGKKQMAQNIVDIIANFRDVSILPLGASIIYGWRSSTGNGFRADLVTQLNDRLYPKVFTCVGNIASGNSRSSAYSNSVAWPGRVISQVHGNATEFLSDHSCPKVTLIHAGTNDMNMNIAREQAPQRMAGLLDYLFETCPDMSIFVAQLMMAKNPTTEANIEEFNTQIPGIVNQRAQQGKKIVTVNMHDVIHLADMKDKIHPNDHGYQLMANAWSTAMVEAAQKGWF